MPYLFRCPLCLKTLGPTHELVAFHITDSTSAEPFRSSSFDCGESDFFEAIVRWGGDAIYTPLTENSVFISHVQCDAVNPFWNETKTPGDGPQPGKVSGRIEIPGKITQGTMLEAALTCTKTGLSFSRKMEHKLILMLRDTYKYNEQHRPMWFPFALLRSTATPTDQELRRPFGSLVEMASAKGVGKTILTLQLMNKKSFAGSTERGFASDAFFFPRREGDVGMDMKSAFLRELFFHSTWAARPEFRPPPTTEVTSGDLRAIFIRPPRARAAVPVRSNGAGSMTNHLKFWPRAWQKASDFIIYILDELEFRKKPELPAMNVDRELAKGDYWHTILFYDTSGEMQIHFGEVTRAVRSLTNKLAICIDAGELFSPDGNNDSINHACDRISTMDQERSNRKRGIKSCCLIVTKLDTLPLNEEQMKRLRALAENLDADDTKERNQLIKWLEEYSDTDKDNLRRYLRSHENYIERVFFVWTENLPKMSGIRTYPIASFEPKRGAVGTEVTIRANMQYDFTKATKLSFNGKEADFRIESDEIIKATVPEGATTGFIEIEGKLSGDAQDEGTSEQHFIVEPSTRRDNTPRDLPQSFGLVKFLAWCLDKSPRELVEDFQADTKRAGEATVNAGS